MQQQEIIKPQKGYQELALSSPADIVIGGGSAGAGKTYCLLMDPIRDIKNKDFTGVIFRRTTPQITNAGALWDQTNKLYNFLKGKSNKTLLTWLFPSGSSIKFAHLEYEKNLKDWQGSEICFLGFDELTHFSKSMFFYMLSRNRSTSGIRPYVRATCNPDPDSWVAELIAWWIDEDGYPDPEKQGVLRYFAKHGDDFIWGDTKEECYEKAKYFIDPLLKKAREKTANITVNDFIKSITFIGGTIYDNSKLLEKDPGYLANLAAQDEDQRKQLLDGNWKVAINPIDIFNYTTFSDIFTNSFVPVGEKRITIDSAMGGKDKLMILVFDGRRLIDLKIMSKSSGKDIIDNVKAFQAIYRIPNSRVCYDADGVGAFIGGDQNGFIAGAIAFHNGGKAIDTVKETRKFRNLKAQCYYLAGDRVDAADYYIEEKVANMMYDDKMTIRQRFLYERKCIKKKVRKNEEPHDLISKDEMKRFIDNESPDLMDALMMNEYFEIVPKKKAPKSTVMRRR